MSSKKLNGNGKTKRTTTARAATPKNGGRPAIEAQPKRDRMIEHRPLRPLDLLALKTARRAKAGLAPR